MQRDAAVFEARRLAALPRIRRGESLSAIARQLGVSRQAVHQWRNSPADEEWQGCVVSRAQVARRNWLAHNWLNFHVCWRAAPRSTDLRLPSGPHNASPICSGGALAFAMTAITSAACCICLVGVGKSLPAALGNETRRPSSAGSSRLGRA